MILNESCKISLSDGSPKKVWYHYVMASMRDPQGMQRVQCHACDAMIEGEPAGRGLLMFPRGDYVEYEEPPLCSRCALAIGVTALMSFAEEEEEG